MSEMLSVVTPLAWEYDVSLIDQTLSHCHVNLRCDPIVLRWILVNLLTETVKGSHHGGTIWIRSELTNVGTLRISILDARRHGTTTSPQLDLLDREEDRAYFHRPIQEVGLSLIQWYVELMGGQLAAMSKYGQDRSIWIDLPMEDLRDDSMNEENVSLV